MWRLIEYIRKAFRDFLERIRRGPTRLERDHEAPAFELVSDDAWDSGIAERIEPALRLVVSLIKARDFEQLFRRTGIRVESPPVRGRPQLPLFLELDRSSRAQTLARLMITSQQEDGFALKIPRAFANELEDNPELAFLSARFEWHESPISTSNAEGHASALQRALERLIGTKGVKRVSLPSPLQPCLEDSLLDMDMPPDRKVQGRTVDGNGIVVGIIDDGCALAHRNFLDPAVPPAPGAVKSRIRYLWDQSRTDTTGGIWTTPLGMDGHQDFQGLELTHPAIDTALGMFVTANGLIEEDKVYEHLKYEIGLASHGTRVMDIAAGNGQSLMGTAGVAPAADIIFVQLPTALVEEGGPVLEDHIYQGVAYVFARAAALGAERGLGKPVPAVVNISYGGYSGSHDGTGPAVAGIEQLLQGQTDRAVVVSAGNGFEADCHAREVVQPGPNPHQLHWNLRPEDPTANHLEIWYPGNARLELSITPPGALSALNPRVPLGKNRIVKRRIGGGIAGWIYHAGPDPGSGLNVIHIYLNSTVGEDDPRLKMGGAAPPQTQALGQAPPALPALTAPVPSGTWRLELWNPGTAPVTFDAWIARDDLGRRGSRQQSRFDPRHADPLRTVADLATGNLAICVGAHNTATSEMCRYSAAGPTRDGRPKPDVCAPGEEDVAGRGVLCASSRSAQPSRMNGTSAAAPHVTGLVALMMQYNRDTGGGALAADVIRAKIAAGATAGQTLGPPPLRAHLHNRHQEVDSERLPGKLQKDHFDKVVGAGKTNVPEAAKLLP
jgi:subtilisin family serine protease